MCGTDATWRPSKRPKPKQFPAVRALHQVQPMRCLIVDDDLSLRELLERIVRVDGHRVQSAPDLEAARVCEAQAPCDVMVLDLELPGLHGAEAIDEARQ